jgi:replicative DNA helicase
MTIALRRELGDLPSFDLMLGPVLDEMAEEKQQPIDATPTPWELWNAACRGAGGGVGIARGWHVIVAARSGNGKSLLGANMAVTAMRAGELVCFISLEMSAIELQSRVMSIVSGRPARDMEHGPNFRPASWEAAKRELHRIFDEHRGALYLNRDPISKLRDIADSIRARHEYQGVRYFIIDYMQLAHVSRAADILDRVTEVSMEVRGLAKELGVTTVGMSQLNRQSSTAKETPRKEGLMGGSPLENDADQVLLLDHSRIQRTARGIESWAVLDKNRSGMLVEIPTLLNSSTLEMRQRLDDEIRLREVA